MVRACVWTGIILAIYAITSGCTSSDSGAGVYPSGQWESKSSTIVAEPSDLDCRLRDSKDTDIPGKWRSGETIGFYGYTPPICVTCEKVGYYPYSTVVHAQMSGRAGAASLLLGGVTALAQHSATGVGLLYPTEIHVRLEPKQFPSVAARDRWYEERIDEVRRERRQTLQFELAGCNQTECEEIEADFEARLGAEIRAMHARRLSAKVVPE